MRPDLLDAPPDGSTITDYDRRHFVLYMRLLDADAVGADWRDVVFRLFALDPTVQSDRARQVHSAHLARARWMSQLGYRVLLAKRDE